MAKDTADRELACCHCGALQTLTAPECDCCEDNIGLVVSCPGCGRFAVVAEDYTLRPPVADDFETYPVVMLVRMMMWRMKWALEHGASIPPLDPAFADAMSAAETKH